MNIISKSALGGITTPGLWDLNRIGPKGFVLLGHHDLANIGKMQGGILFSFLTKASGSDPESCWVGEITWLRGL